MTARLKVHLKVDSKVLHWGQQTVAQTVHLMAERRVHWLEKWSDHHLVLQLEQQMEQKKVAMMVAQMDAQMAHPTALTRGDRSVAQKDHHLAHLWDVLTVDQRVDRTDLPMAENLENLTVHWTAAL